MFRHAVWLLNMFQLHSSDNKTSFHRRWSIAYSSSVLPFGELVLVQDHRLQPQSSLAIWLGRCEDTNEHILATANSSSLIKNRIVTKLSLESSMDITLFKSISLPPELTSTASLKKVRFGVQLIEEMGGEEELRLESSPQAYIKHPQQTAEGRHSGQPRALPVSFHLPPGLAHPPLAQACPYDMPDLAWQQPALAQQHSCSKQLCTHQLCNSQLQQQQLVRGNLLKSKLLNNSL